MVEPREGSGFELEALDEGSVFDQAGHQRLESHFASERLLDGAIDDSHPTGAKSLFHVVVAQLRAGQVLHARRQG